MKLSRQKLNKAKDTHSLHITDTWLTNGKFALRKELSDDYCLTKGYEKKDFGKTFRQLPHIDQEMDRVIKGLDNNYKTATLKEDYFDMSFNRVKAIVLNAEHGEVRIDYRYSSLLKKGVILVKDDKSPVFIRNDNGILAVIMPLRKI